MRRPLILPAVILLSAGLATLARAAALRIQGVSVNLQGSALANASSSPAAISADGRYVVFTSNATNLVAGSVGLNFTQHVYWRDTVGNITRMVDAAANGTASSTEGQALDVSADGRYVLFTSRANNLAAGLAVSGQHGNVYVRDVLNGVTALVSVNAAGNQEADGEAGSASLTPDGRYVAFVSAATNLVTGVNNVNRTPNAYVRDLQASVTRLVSVGRTGGVGNGPSASPSISADGRYVAFASEASNLIAVPKTTPGSDVYVRDVLNGVTAAVSVGLNGKMGNGVSALPLISADGSTILFDSQATGLSTTPDQNNTTDVYAWSRETGAIVLVSQNNADSGAGNAASTRLSLSADGRYAAFASAATDLTALADTNEAQDLFVRDLKASETALATVNAGGTAAANHDALQPGGVSANGRFVAFASNASDLSSVIPNANRRPGVWVRDVLGETTTSITLTADGRGASGLAAAGRFSADGRSLGFGSGATDLVPLPKGNQGAQDAYVARLNAPPVAADDRYSVAVGATLTVALPGVLANDTDADGDPLTAFLVDAPTHGAVTLNAGGAFVYAPDAGFSGVDRFTYRATDGAGNSNVGVVTVSVKSVNHPPVAVDDAYTVNQGSTLTLAAPAVLGNDTDPDFDPLVAVLVSGPAHGSLSMQVDGSLSYRPDAGFYGTDAFTYRASDGEAQSNLATVTLTVERHNHAPVAGDDAYSTLPGVALTLPAAGVLANDTDADGDPLTAVLVDTTTHGALTLNGDGSFTYTPDAGFTGADHFTYRATDGEMQSALATVTLTVARDDHAPVGVADSYVVSYATPLTVAAPGVLANDTDAENDPLTAQLLTSPAHGSVTLNAAGSFVYTPAIGFQGDDTFTYRPVGGGVNGNSTTVTLHVSQNPPASTPGAKVTGSGSYKAGATSQKFTLSASVSRTGTPSGKISFRLPDGNTYASTSLQSVSVASGHGLIFGKARSQKTRLVISFIIEAVGGKSGTARFGLRTSSGVTAELQTVSSGRITVSP